MAGAKLGHGNYTDLTILKGMTISLAAHCEKYIKNRY